MHPSKWVGVASLVLSVSLTGCNPSNHSQAQQAAKADVAPTASSSQSSRSTSPAVVPSVAPSAEALAGQLVAALDTGALPAKQLTPEFRQKLAPKAFSEAHADEICTSWLAQARGTIGAIRSWQNVGALPGATAFLAQTKDQTLALRFTGSQPPMLDWFSMAPSSTLVIPATPPLGAAGFTVVAFVQSLHMTPKMLAAEEMALDWKSRIAPPFDSDRAKGYNEGLLLARLHEMREQMTPLEIVSWTEETVRWKRPGRLTEQVFRLTAGGRPWDRQIVAIESFP